MQPITGNSNLTKTNKRPRDESVTPFDQLAKRAMNADPRIQLARKFYEDAQTLKTISLETQEAVSIAETLESLAENVMPPSKYLSYTRLTEIINAIKQLCCLYQNSNTISSLETLAYLNNLLNLYSPLCPIPVSTLNDLSEDTISIENSEDESPTNNNS